MNIGKRDRPAGAWSQRGGLVAVVLAQCLGTSLWFSPAGAAGGIIARWHLQPAEFSWLLAATQLGFIGGSFLIALTGTADRWPASRLFGISCVAGALANAILVLPGLSFATAWCIRALVGISLAGIYPLGMKLVVQWVGGRPALALAWLVAMLTLGTAMPHALRAYGIEWPWEYVLFGASLLALAGGALVVSVGDGTFKPISSPALSLNAHDLRSLLKNPALRASAGGYFGHMWELYAFWSVVPTLSAAALRSHGMALASDPFASWYGWLAACVIGAGALGCVLGGYAVRVAGSAKVACAALAGSGLICALYPLLPATEMFWRIMLLMLWGVLVVADSPQFSALSSQAAPPQLLGLALVLQNGIGFLISVVSIVTLGVFMAHWGERALWLLPAGPLLGVWAMRTLVWPGTKVRGSRPNEIA